MKPPEFIIFDCDGVLIDSEILANELEVTMKSEFGFRITLEEQLRKYVGMGKNHPLMVEELKKLPENYLQQMDDRIRPIYRDRLQVIPGTMEFLTASQIPRCVASSSEAAWLDLKLEIVGLKKYFGSGIFHGELVKECKPAPDLFLHAVERMGWAGKQGLVIEDSVYGVQAARSAGIEVYGFLGGAHIREGHGERLFKAGASKLIQDLRELRF